MRISRLESIIDATWPLRMVVYLYGIPNNEANPIYRWTYALFALSLHGIPAFWIHPSDLDVDPESIGPSNVFYFGIWTKVLANFVTILAWTTLGARSIREALLRIRDVDEALRALGRRTDHRGFVKTELGLLAAFLVLLALKVFVEFAEDSPNSFQTRILAGFYLYVQNVQHMVNEIPFIFVLCAIRLRFKSVNDIISQFSEEGNETSDIRGEIRREVLAESRRRNIHRAYRINRELCDSSERLNAAFSCQILVSIGTSFCAILGTISKISVNEDWETFDPTSVFATIYHCAAIFVPKILTIAVVCSTTSEEANKLGISLHRIRIEDAKGHRQVQEYSGRANQRHLHFTAGGLLSIDKSLASSVLSTSITYTVVLFQLL